MKVVTSLREDGQFYCFASNVGCEVPLFHEPNFHILNHGAVWKVDIGEAVRFRLKGGRSSEQDIEVRAVAKVRSSVLRVPAIVGTEWKRIGVVGFTIGDMK